MGEMVLEKINEIGMSKAEFGRRIHTSRQNINTLLNKADWSVVQLAYASKALSTNFFEVVAGKLLGELGSENAQKGTGLRVLVELEDVEEIADFLALWRDRQS